ncbi:hypothetical protein PG989_010912 [Apiospora arundinis]
MSSISLFRSSPSSTNMPIMQLASTLRKGRRSRQGRGERWAGIFRGDKAAAARGMAEKALRAERCCRGGWRDAMRRERGDAAVWRGPGCRRFRRSSAQRGRSCGVPVHYAAIAAKHVRFPSPAALVG